MPELCALSQQAVCALNRYPDTYGIHAIESCRARQFTFDPRRGPPHVGKAGKDHLLGEGLREAVRILCRPETHLDELLAPYDGLPVD
jgi:hypothetical protein